MGRKNHARPGRRLVELVDENRTHTFEPFHDEAVVHNLMADIDGRPELLERQFHDADRAIDAGAEAARRGQHKREGWSAVISLILRRTSHESPAWLQSR